MRSCRYAAPGSDGSAPLQTDNPNGHTRTRGWSNKRYRWREALNTVPHPLHWTLVLPVNVPHPVVNTQHRWDDHQSARWENGSQQMGKGHWKPQIWVKKHEMWDGHDGRSRHTAEACNSGYWIGPKNWEKVPLTKESVLGGIFLADYQTDIHCMWRRNTVLVSPCLCLDCNIEEGCSGLLPDVPTMLEVILKNGDHNFLSFFRK